jgi:hypothetical protein
VLQNLGELLLAEFRQDHFACEPVGLSCGADLENEFPFARHVEHQSLGAPASGTERFHFGRIVHAVTVLGHVRVDFDRLRDRGRLCADRDLKRKELSYLG